MKLERRLQVGGREVTGWKPTEMGGAAMTEVIATALLGLANVEDGWGMNGRSEVSVFNGEAEVSYRLTQ